MPDKREDVDNLLRGVPRFRDATQLHWSTLSGGMSHSSVRVQADGVDFAVRLPALRPAGWPAQALHDEWRVLSVTSAAGLAPEPEWCDEKAGLIVTRFVEGAVWTTGQMRDSTNWPRLTAILRSVHAINLALPPFDPVGAAQAYWKHYCTVAQPGDRTLAAWRSFNSETDDLLAALECSCLCHNDVMHSNVLGSKPVLLDWEFAARSDPLFDLATVIVYHNLSTAQGAALLSEYLGGNDPAARQRLALLCRLCRYVSWLWCLALLGREPAAEDWAVALPV